MRGEVKRKRLGDGRGVVEVGERASEVEENGHGEGVVRESNERGGMGGHLVDVDLVAELEEEIVGAVVEELNEDLIRSKSSHVDPVVGNGGEVAPPLVELDYALEVIVIGEDREDKVLIVGDAEVISELGAELRIPAFVLSLHNGVARRGH